MLIDLSLTEFSAFLLPRQQDSHKGIFGHVLVMGGDEGFAGAAIMAGMAALRIGAGLVSLATHLTHASLIAAMHPELMSHGVSKKLDLIPLVKKATALVIGPGLGVKKWGHNLLEVGIKADLPMIVDADGLNILAKHPLKQTNWVLTPHPGEAARLLETTVSAVQSDRIGAVTSLQKRYGGVVVLKGAGTLIATGEEGIRRCPYGNPGMATGGMGDILSGVIGGFLAAGIKPMIAASLGVLVHSLAADSAAKKGERGMIATDILPYLREWVNPKS